MGPVSIVGLASAMLQGPVLCEWDASESTQGSLESGVQTMTVQQIQAPPDPTLPGTECGPW